jgi:hypothetical protein
MSKDKKETKRKKQSSAGKNSTSKKNEPKKQLPPGKAPENMTDTWVGTAYRCGAILRVGQRMLAFSHPATYVKLAKDHIGLPIAQSIFTDSAQDSLYIAGEVIEFVISPTTYVVNKIGDLMTSTSGEVIKNCYNIKHPEARAAVDILCTEAARKTTTRLFSSMRDNHGSSVFFQAAKDRKSLSPNSSQRTDNNSNRSITQIRSKL